MTVWLDLPLAAFSLAKSSVSCTRLIASFRMRSHLVLPVLPVCAGVRGFPVLPSCALRRTATSCLARALEGRLFTGCCFVLVFALVFAFVELATMVYSLMERLQNAVVQPWDHCGHPVGLVWWQRGGRVGCPYGEKAPGNSCAPRCPTSTRKRPQYLRP